MPEILPYIKAIYDYLTYRANYAMGNIVSIKPVAVLEYARLPNNIPSRAMVRYLLGQLARAYGGEVIVRNDSYIYRFSVPTLRRITGYGFDAFAKLIEVIEGSQA